MRSTRLLPLVLTVMALVIGVTAAEAQNSRSNNPDVSIVNRYSSAITELYASPTTEQGWRSNRLGGSVIRPNGYYDLVLERGIGCIWDIRVVYQNGYIEEKRSQALCEIQQVVFDGRNVQLPQQGQQGQQGPQGQRPQEQLGQRPQDPPRPPPQSQLSPQPPVPPNPPQTRSADTMIINQGPATIVALYVQPANGGEWSQDRLGSSTLRPPGRHLMRMLAGQGCMWNLRAHFAGGAIETRNNIDLCSTPEVLLSGRAQPGQAMSSGTGFYVSRAGHVLTTFHTVRNCSAVVVARQGGQRVAMVKVADDAENDLALYRIPDLVSPVAPFRMANAPMRPGERLVVVGYPARRTLGQVTVVESSVTAATGARGEATRFQFQGGPVEEPWGAPIYDQNGLVVGIANDPQFIGRAGTAVSREAIQRFLKAHNVDTVEVSGNETRRVPSPQDYAFPVVLPLDCLN